jgi:adenylate cyclase
MTGRNPGRVCPHCGKAARQRDRFCASCGRPLPSASLQVQEVPDTALGEQRKLVTVLFADLAASTVLGESHDPEDTRALYSRYFAALARQIRRYDGTIDKYVGDAVMAVFGAPVSHEDDAERAIRAGLAMQAAIAALNDEIERTRDVRLGMRVGIHTGEVVAGLLAGDDQHAYTVVGDVVNTADRFQKACPVGDVLVSELTRRLAHDAFEFAAMPAVEMKGKSAPVVPYRVVRSRDDEVLPELGRMVDAASERERLRAALAEAVLGRGRAIDVTGEPGVGKSRLVLEFRRDLAPSIQRVVVRCASYQVGTPYVLLADLVRTVFGIHVTDAAGVARDKLNEGCARYRVYLSPEILTLVLEILGFGARTTLAPELVRQLLVATVRDLLANATADAPLVMVIEDVQWMDKPSALVIAELVPDLSRQACLIVATSRTGSRMPWPAERIELAPLGDADARELASDLGSAGIAKELLERLLERTSGNPFFIEEVLRQLREGDTEVPATVQEVIEAHLDRLAPGPRHLIEVAAVVGRSFWLPLLRRLVPRSTLAEDLAALEQEGFLVRRTLRPELTYAFRQPLLQEVAYGVQLLAGRRGTHGRVAAAIESLYAQRIAEFTDVLAYHWARSDDQPKALEWLVRAGDRARSLYANDEALAAYRSALERAQDGGGPLSAGTIFERIADVETLVGRYDDAIASFARAAERGGAADRAFAGRLLRKTGAAHRWKGDYPAALVSFAVARETLGAASGPEAAHIALEEGMAHFHRGDYTSARAAVERGVEVGRRLEVADVLAEGLKILGNIANNLGDLREATRAYEQSLGMYERLGDPVGIADLHSNVGNMYRRTGRYEEALAEHRRSLALRERIGHRWHMSTSHNNIGEVFRSMGRPAEAIPEFERALETWDAVRGRAGAGLARMNLGMARVEAGDVPRGREDLRAALAQLEGTKFLPSAHRDLASAELAAGDLAAATLHAERALAMARAAGARQVEAQAERVLAQIALARGDKTAARALLERSKRTLIELGEAADLARTDAVLATVGP